MSRILGIIEVSKKEMVDGSVVPSAVHVKHLWTRVVDDADKVEDLLANIYGRIMKLKKWHTLGLVTEEEVENAEEWHQIRLIVLKRLFRYRSEDTFLEGTFTDGSGI